MHIAQSYLIVILGKLEKVDLLSPPSKLLKLKGTILLFP